jgi:DNA-binding IclR family transcriptional regulator
MPALNRSGFIIRMYFVYLKPLTSKMKHVSFQFQLWRRRPGMGEDTNISEAKDPYIVGSLQRGLRVVQAFQSRDSWSLTELCAHLSESKATLFRILHTLEDFNYVVKDEVTGRYRLGLGAYAIGNTAMRNEQLRWQALPPLQNLAVLTGETVFVGILYDGQSICVQLVEGGHAVRMHSFVGKRSPAHANVLGKVQLAHLHDSELDHFIGNYGLEGFTPNTITDAPRLKEELRIIRERGYAIDNEELEIGLKCVGALITDHTGRAFATVSVAGPTARLMPDRIEWLATQVRETAGQISHMLGSAVMHGRSRPTAA